MPTTTPPASPPSARRTPSGDSAWWVAAFVIGTLALIVATVAFFTGTGSQAAESAAAAGGETEFDVELGEMYVSPSSIVVPAGQAVTLHVTNSGVMAHDLVVGGDGAGTRMLAPGESETVVIGPFTESSSAWCTVPGHREAGMVMAITVLGGAPPASGGHGAVAPGGTVTGAQIDPNASPAEGWEARDPIAPATPGGTVHEFTLVATEEIVEVAPGVTQEMWLFGGEFPGPVLRGKVGDTFRITLVNEGRIGHSIDFHASKVAWDKEMRTINTGESLIYEFEAKHAGVFMYHCGTAPALHHIGNGMHGVIIIDPPELAPVDEEFVLVQSELYLGDEGQPGDLGKMMNDAWDAVVFNGYHSQYLHSPIAVETGKRYRVYAMNNGPSENSAFHIVGTVFDTVYKEGAYRLQPDEMQGGAQVLDLQPAQGGFVEFEFDADGLYPIVTHKFSNVGKGAIGLFASGDVDAAGAGGH